MINVLERLGMAAYVIFTLPWVLIILIIKTKGEIEEMR